jgi:cyclopropane fatty-acyl-phospholipid synthase-like methyltransferase
MACKQFAEQYDAVICEPRMQRLYGASGYFNVGYWTGDTPNLAAACDRLVDEVAAAIPREASVIVDVGCGLGAGTCRVAKQFPRALVIGANLSLWQLAGAQRRGVEAPVAMDAARLALGSGTVDAVLAVESAQHFDTRAAFLAEVRRVLRPGGVLAIADMLFKNADVIGSWMVPQQNRITTTTQYASLLVDAGFVDLTVRDISAVSWHPFCNAMRTVFEGHEDTVCAIEDSLAHYVLAFAHSTAPS